MAKDNEEKIYENLQSIEDWALSGVSQKEMAEMLGMAYSTFRDYKTKIPALSAVLKKCADILQEEKAKQVDQVERSLFQRCMGYNAKVKKIQKVKKPMKDEDGEIMFAHGKMLTEEVLEEVTEEQHVPADVTAIKFFLLNKARKDWKNDPERLAIEKKRLQNDTKRTKLAEHNAAGGGEGRSVEDILSECAAKIDADGAAGFAEQSTDRVEAGGTGV